MSQKIKCKKCGDIIQSMHRHDYHPCKCGLIAIDGGNDYCRIIGNAGNWEFVKSGKVDDKKN